MKFLKGFLIVILTLVAIYFVLALFGPNSYTVKRSKEIDAPAKVVFKQVSDFKNWENWSPWQEKDTSIKNTYKGTMGEIQAQMSWIGDDELSGTGSMTITAVEPNKSLTYSLKFTTPFEMESKGSIKLKETNEKTTVTWFDQGDIDFLARPFMLFMNLDAQIGPDFERGLIRLDSVSQMEIKKNQKKPIKITENTFPSRTYLGIRHETKLSKVLSPNFLEENFMKLGLYLGENNLKIIDGTSRSLFTYKWNEKDSTCIVVPAFALENISEVNNSKFELIKVNEQKVVTAKYYGSYEDMGRAYEKLEKYIQENGLEADYSLEEYMNDPASVESPNEILTHITYFLK